MRETRFKVGDRVTRDPIDRLGSTRHGTVSKIHESYRDWMNQYHIIYSVIWDDTKLEETGYLEVGNGLKLEEAKLG
jgi:hypothetical protein